MIRRGARAERPHATPGSFDGVWMPPVKVFSEEDPLPTRRRVARGLVKIPLLCVHPGPPSLEARSSAVTGRGHAAQMEGPQSEAAGMLQRCTQNSEEGKRERGRERKKRKGRERTVASAGRCGPRDPAVQPGFGAAGEGVHPEGTSPPLPREP